MIDVLNNFKLESVIVDRIVTSVVLILFLWLIKTFVCFLMRRKITDPAKYYHWRTIVIYTYSLLAIVLIGRIWVAGIDSIAQLIGLLGAGLAIAMHDTIANLAGWAYILWFKPFKVGDRIEIGGIGGDVIDIRLFQFSMIEIGNWVDADHSTGRIVHVPNSKAFREPMANYEIGFEYIWHEIPVLVTFESNWEKAKQILADIAKVKAEPLSQGAEAQIKRAAMKYLIYFNRLSPIVYTSVKESGIMLSMRYIVKPRQRRTSNQDVWEAILREFAKHDDISLAYPTTRFYARSEKAEGDKLPV
jgi:small-conductance mechanosensitive channel